MNPASLRRAERLTLAVLICGVASLALSDFVSPFYWLLVATAALLRLAVGARLALSEMQASLIGWLGFVWVGAELALGRAWIVAFTDFLLILALAVTVEEATPRNHLHRMLVGLFLVLASAVLTDSVLFVLPLAALLWFMWRAAACLYGLNWPGGDLPAMPLARDLRLISMMALVTGLLFVALPRFDFHSQLKPTQPRMATSGFSDRVQLGDFARELDATVVMRVEPAGGDVLAFHKAMQGRYWRGATLGLFTGDGWQRLPDRPRHHWPRDADVVLAAGEGMPIAVYREASDHRFIQLPAGLLRIDGVPAAVYLDDQGMLRFMRPPVRRLKLRMVVGGAQPPPPGLRPPVAAESDAGRVPAALREWVGKVIGDATDDRVRLERIAATLRGWQYDLQAPVDAAHPIVSFLGNRRGHCELFATTMALAARSIGVPARVVNGYFGGEWNGMGGFLLIRQQHAHSWTEVWLAGRWQRIDATPPSRWSLSGIRFPALDEVWETVRFSWYRYVLEFQNEDRSGLLSSLWQSMRDRLPALFAATLVLILLASGWRGWRRRIRPSLPVQWRLMDRWLHKRGIRRAPHQPLRMLPVPAGVRRDAWRHFVGEWEAQAYGREAAWGRWRLKRHLRALCRRGC